jgi:aminopeptidase N
MAGSFAATPELEPGVSLELARWRAQHYRDVRYALEFDLRAGADAVEGRVEVSVAFRGAPEDLVLDWRGGQPAERVRDLELNGQVFRAARFQQEHLLIPREALKRGSNVVSLRFRSPVSSAGGAITRFADGEDGSEYWYTLFVPADASSVFPCFDQPDLKASFSLQLSAPKAWRVVSNAALAESREDGERLRHRFRASEPISTYLFAFAAGPFEEIAESGTAARPGPVRLLVRRSKLERARGEAGEVLRLNRDSLAWFERYFRRPFPFAKYDLVLVPELPYGGMEHAGATFLREESVLFPFQPSAPDLLRRAQLVLHENSHQWFGDLVTMRWFDDLWLKEGFANFMAAKASAELLPGRLPEAHPWIAFNALKSAAYRTDITHGTTPIWQAMDNLQAAKSAYGNIVYSKGPAVLRQAEFFAGEAAFRRGVHDFLARHAYGSASWGDLVRALERASGERLGPWADAWVKRRGMPRVQIGRVLDSSGRLREVSVSQHDVLGGGGLWPMRLRLVTLADGRVKHYELRLAGEKTSVPTRGAGRPELVFANDGDYGYGQFLLDADSRAYALGHPGDIKDDLLRALVLDSLWESVREAELDPARYLELALAWLPSERDEITAAVLLTRLRAAYTRYLSPRRRAALAERVEAFVAGQMHGAPTASRRIAYFRTLVGIARSERGRAQLKDLLSGHERIEGVPLRSRDRFGIVEALLAAGDPEASALLEAQTREDASAEGRRYAFGAAAARADASGKLALFQRFTTDTQLPESWIEEALGPLNELDQADLTRPLLEEALRTLPALKRERKIFFVNDWLAAFIGGQSSAEALDAVQRFVASTKLDADLRLKVLEAMDVLERTVRVRARYEPPNQL